MLRPRRCTDPVSVLPEQGVTGYALHGLDRGPAPPTGCLVYLWHPRRQARDGPCAHLFWIFLGAVGARRGGDGSGLGRSPTAQRPQGLDAGTDPDACLPGREDQLGSAATHDRSSSRVGPGSRRGRVRRAAPAYLGARPPAVVRRRDGDRGVSTGAAARSWSAVQRGPAATRVAGSWPRVHRRSGVRRSPTSRTQADRS